MTIASPLVPPTHFTPEDVFHLEQGDALYELVDGQLVEKQMSSLANKTAVAISAELFNYCRRTKSGHEVYAEQTYECFPHDSDLVRRPDISLIIASRLNQVPPEGHIRIAPDLAVEVISPNDRIYEFERKLLDYRRAEIPLVWEVNPEFRFIRVHRPGRAPEKMEENDQITAAPVLPEFAIRVGDLLPGTSKLA